MSLANSASSASCCRSGWITFCLYSVDPAFGPGPWRSQDHHGDLLVELRLGDVLTVDDTHIVAGDKGTCNCGHDHDQGKDFEK